MIDTERRIPPEPAEADPEMLRDLKRLVRLVEESLVDQARELAPQLAEKWPDSCPIQHLAWVLEPPRVIRKRLGSTRPRFEQEYAWVRTHAHQYPGLWLAVHGDRLIAADPNIGKVRKAAQAAAGDEDVLFHYQPPLEA